MHYAAVAQPRLRASIVCHVALGLGSFIPVWMIAPYAEQSGVPVVWIGVIWAVANYCVALETAEGADEEGGAANEAAAANAEVLCLSAIASG